MQPEQSSLTPVNKNSGNGNGNGNAKCSCSQSLEIFAREKEGKATYRLIACPTSIDTPKIANGISMSWFFNCCHCRMHSKGCHFII